MRSRNCAAVMRSFSLEMRFDAAREPGDLRAAIEIVADLDERTEREHRFEGFRDSPMTRDRLTAATAPANGTGSNGCPASIGTCSSKNARCSRVSDGRCSSGRIVTAAIDQPALARRNARATRTSTVSGTPSARASAIEVMPIAQGSRRCASSSCASTRPSSVARGAASTYAGGRRDANRLASLDEPLERFARDRFAQVRGNRDAPSSSRLPNRASRERCEASLLRPHLASAAARRSTPST